MSELLAPQWRPRIASVWPSLTQAILKAHYTCYKGEQRIIWRGMPALFHWCCWRPMRKGRIEYRPEGSAWGWARAAWRIAACPYCGRFKEVL